MSTSGAPEAPLAPAPDALATTRYIADITAGLSKLARASDLDVLAYLLDLASLEAEESAQKLPFK